MTQPLHATITGASMSQSRWMPRWPRRMSSWCDSSVFWVPIEPTSRPGRERLALAPPHDRPDVGAGRELVEDREQLRVHLVVERVVLVGVVVGDRRDRAVDFEPHPRPQNRSSAGNYPRRRVLRALRAYRRARTDSPAEELVLVGEALRVADRALLANRVEALVELALDGREPSLHRRPCDRRSRPPPRTTPGAPRRVSRPVAPCSPCRRTVTHCIPFIAGRAAYVHRRGTRGSSGP